MSSNKPRIYFWGIIISFLFEMLILFELAFGILTYKETQSMVFWHIYVSKGNSFPEPELTLYFITILIFLIFSYSLSSYFYDRKQVKQNVLKYYKYLLVVLTFYLISFVIPIIITIQAFTNWNEPLIFFWIFNTFLYINFIVIFHLFRRTLPKSDKVGLLLILNFNFFTSFIVSILILDFLGK